MRISDWSSDVCSSDLIARQTERLADLGDCTARAVAGDDCGQRREVAAVGLVDPLDDLLASFVLEVDVDVRRLLALARDEPLEQELVLDRIDRGDTEQSSEERRVGKECVSTCRTR